MVLVLINAAREIIGEAGVERSVRFAGENVDPVEFFFAHGRKIHEGVGVRMILMPRRRAADGSPSHALLRQGFGGHAGDDNCFRS